MFGEVAVDFSEGIGSIGRERESAVEYDFGYLTEGAWLVV
jgi:hypothetical protein